MGYGGAFFGGLLGGAIGAAIWAAIGYSTGYEVGWVAWGVGLLVGLGVLFGSRGRAGVTGGVVAALFAVTAVAAGKYAVVSLSYKSQVEQLPVAAFADVVAQEYADAGIYVEWPDEEARTLQQLYPGDIWAEAQSRFDNLVPSEQQELTDALLAEEGDIVSASLLGSIGIFDLIWVVLAVGTAAKLGASSSEPRDDEPIKLIGEQSSDGLAIIPPAGGRSPGPVDDGPPLVPRG